MNTQAILERNNSEYDDMKMFLQRLLIRYVRNIILEPEKWDHDTKWRRKICMLDYWRWKNYENSS